MTVSLIGGVSLSVGAITLVSVGYFLIVWAPTFYFLYQVWTRDEEEKFVKPCQCWFDWTWKRQYVYAEMMFRAHCIFCVCSIVVVTAEPGFRDSWYWALLTVFLMVTFTATLGYTSQLSHRRIPTDDDQRALIVRSVRSLTIDQDTAFGDVLRTRKTQMFGAAPMPVGSSAGSGGSSSAKDSSRSKSKSKLGSHSEGAPQSGAATTIVHGSGGHSTQTSKDLVSKMSDMHALAEMELSPMDKSSTDKSEAAADKTTADDADAVDSDAENDDDPPLMAFDLKPTIVLTPENTRRDSVKESGKKSEEIEQVTSLSQQDKDELDKAWEEAEAKETDDESVEKEKTQAMKSQMSVERVNSESSGAATPL